MTPGAGLVERWSSPDFTATVGAWVSASYAEARSVTAHKVRPWAAVWRVVTERGTVWAKQSCPGQAFEPTLLPLLAERAPDLVVRPVAADAEASLLATHDAGPTLDAPGADEESLTRTRTLLRAAAELQRRTADAAALRAAGLPSLTAGDLPSYVEEVLDRFAGLPPGDPRHLTRPTAERLRAGTPALRRDCATVAELGLPLAVQHNDLHPGNACGSTAGAGALRFFDFADAVLAEPLGVLARPLAELAGARGTTLADPAVRGAAEPALEVWSDLAPPAALRAALPAALRVGTLTGLAPWLRSFPTMTTSDLATWGAVPGQVLAAGLLDPDA